MHTKNPHSNKITNFPTPSLCSLSASMATKGSERNVGLFFVTPPRAIKHIPEELSTKQYCSTWSCHWSIGKYQHTYGSCRSKANGMQIAHVHISRAYPQIQVTPLLAYVIIRNSKTCHSILYCTSFAHSHFPHSKTHCWAMICQCCSTLDGQLRIAKCQRLLVDWG